MNPISIKLASRTSRNKLSYTYPKADLADELDDSVVLESANILSSSRELVSFFLGIM